MSLREQWPCRYRAARWRNRFAHHLPLLPQLFLEPKILYRSAVEQVPTTDYELPLGQAEVLQEGKDLTIVSYGPPLYTVETALHHLRQPDEDLEKLVPRDLRGLSVELIDLRTVMPYDVRPFPSPPSSSSTYLTLYCARVDRDHRQVSQQDWPTHDCPRGPPRRQRRKRTRRRSPATVLPPPRGACQALDGLGHAVWAGV